MRKLTGNINLKTGDGQVDSNLLPSGDHLTKHTPPPPTRLKGTHVSMATSQTCNKIVPKMDNMIKVDKYM